MTSFAILGDVNWENEFIQSRFTENQQNSAWIVKTGVKPEIKRVNNDKSVKNILWHPHKAQWKLETKSSQRNSLICKE